jgi:hypothetical protein
MPFPLAAVSKETATIIRIRTDTATIFPVLFKKSELLFPPFIFSPLIGIFAQL